MNEADGDFQNQFKELDAQFTNKLTVSAGVPHQVAAC